MGTFGASVHPICLGVFWGTSVHLSGILVSVGKSICLSVHNSHVSCSPSLWIVYLLDWMLMDVCCASCCCSYLCNFHYVSSFYTMAMATTPVVTVVCSGTSSLLSMVTMVPSLMGLPGQQDMALPPTLSWDAHWLRWSHSALACGLVCLIYCGTVLHSACWYNISRGKCKWAPTGMLQYASRAKCLSWPEHLAWVSNPLMVLMAASAWP